MVQDVPACSRCAKSRQALCNICTAQLPHSVVGGNTPTHSIDVLHAVIQGCNVILVPTRPADGLPLRCCILCCYPGMQPTLDLLEQHDPDAAASMRSVLKLPRQQYQQLLQVEQLPSSMSREQYAAHAVRQLLVDDVQWQLEAVRQGFAAGTNIQVSCTCC